MRSGSPRVHRHRIRAFVALTAALLALSSALTVASAANGKSFTASISEATLFKGGTYLTGGGGGYPSLGITLTNTSTPDSGGILLGSANIIVPAGITLLKPDGSGPAAVDSGDCYALSGFVASGATACYITSPTLVGDATVDGPVIALRDLSLPTTAGSNTVTVTFPVRTICSVDAGSRTWFIQAKQANNFSGNPGNDLTIDPPDSFPVTTIAAASCRLVFTAQPAPAVKNTTIRSEPFDAAGDPVEVTVATGDTSGPVKPVLFPNVDITLAKATGPGTISGDLGPTTTSGGVATFGPTADTVGSYTLAASDGANVTSATSNPFVIVDVAVECPGNSNCSSGPQSANKSSVDVSGTVGAGGGFATVAFNPPGTEDMCGSGSSGSDVFDVDITSSTSNKTVTITIPKANTTKAANKYDVCVRLPEVFTTKSGAPASAVAGGFEGLLPTCSRSGEPVPCVVSRSTVQGSVVIAFLLKPGDPPGKAM